MNLLSKILVFIIIPLVVGFFIGAGIALSIRAVAADESGLEPGWNLIAGPDQYAAAYVAEHQEVTIIWGYRASGDKVWWEAFARGAEDVPGASDLQYMFPGRGYWVYAGARPGTVRAQPIDAPVPLVAYE